jgi:hypothetical protein
MIGLNKLSVALTRLMNNELERIWKEVVVWIEVVTRHLSEGTEENHRNLNDDNLSPIRDLNPKRPEYAAVLSLDCDFQF